MQQKEKRKRKSNKLLFVCWMVDGQLIALSFSYESMEICICLQSVSSAGAVRVNVSQLAQGR